MPKTWKDIDDIVKLQQHGKHISLDALELAFGKEDTPHQRTLIQAMRGPYEGYTAEVYPLAGKMVDKELQRTRMQKLFGKGIQDLIDDLYIQAKKALKKKKRETAPSTPIEEFEKAMDEVSAPAVEPETALAAEEEEEEVIEAAVATPEGVDVKKSRKGKRGSKTPKPGEPAKKAEPKKKTPPPPSGLKVRDMIEFENLKGNDDMSAYVPIKDDNYEFPDYTLDFVKFLDTGLNLWLHGGTGAGKSSLVEQVCSAGNLPLMYCSFHEDKKPDQLFGGFRLKDGNTVWQDGPVTKAYREGMVLLLDEIDGLPPEIAFSLYAITDGKPLVLEENGNEVVQMHENFRVVATGNTQGRGDETGMYTGTSIQNRAFLNRFRVWYKVNYPKQEVYKKIIMREGATEDVADTLARLANEINGGYNRGTLTETFSLRDAREVATAVKLLDGNIKKALTLTLLNRLSSVEQAAVNQLYDNLVGKKGR